MTDLLGDSLHGRVEEVCAHDVLRPAVQLHAHRVTHSPVLQAGQLEALLNLQKENEDKLGFASGQEVKQR